MGAAFSISGMHYGIRSVLPEQKVVNDWNSIPPRPNDSKTY
jgi:hypothetical protein